MGWLKINIVVCIRILQITNIRGLAVKLYIFPTTLSSYPPCCCPLADTPGRIWCWTTWQWSITTSIVTLGTAPWPLAGELPERCSFHPNLCTNTVGWIKVTPPVSSCVSWTRTQTQGGDHQAQVDEGEEDASHVHDVCRLSHNWVFTQLPEKNICSAPTQNVDNVLMFIMFYIS